MCRKTTTMLLLFLFSVLLSPLASGDYWSERDELLFKEDRAYIGGTLLLSEKEKVVNDLLMKHKLDELSHCFVHPEHFPPAIHFFISKANITRSKVFEFLQKLPKGATLHAHDLALASFETVYNLTYEDNLYGCIVNDKLQLKFFDTPPEDCDWQLLAHMRRNASFEEYVRRQLTIFTDDPYKAYPDGNAVWKKFQDTFKSIVGLLCYRPVFVKYFWKVLEEYYEDNVKYIEFRSILPELYDLNGTAYSPEENIKIYVDVLKDFKHQYPDFVGAKMIYSPMRHYEPTELKQYIRLGLELQEKYPNFIAGFDLVGQEDAGNPLEDFVPELLEISGKIKFFFHAGETNWNGGVVDNNIIDAILLNTTRIGHAFSILKHPEVVNTIKERNIAIEVSPISNQVLRLVDDLRNHPASYLMSVNCPLVISNDDPGMWGSKGLSYDWYMAFMGMSRRNSDLRFLKKLALNSLLYSSMSDIERKSALNQWYLDWDTFLDNMISYSNNILRFDEIFNQFDKHQ